MRFTASEVAAAVGGVVHGADVTIDGVATDSREPTAGTLFVPIVAARDGHDFIDDTLAALAALGRHARERLADHVVAVTGSVGKTSVKDLTAAVLGAHGTVGAARHSFNNEIGLPVTLANAPSDAWATVVEMGA